MSFKTAMLCSSNLMFRGMIMNTNEQMINILNNGFDEITKSVTVDYKQSALMKDPKHIELIERYAKVLSHHFIGKFASLCTAISNADMIDEEQKYTVMNAVERKVALIVADFPKKYETTLKQVKKYFGHSYSSECLSNVTAECFIDDFNDERKNIIDWAKNIQLEDEGITNSTKMSEKVTA